MTVTYGNIVFDHVVYDEEADVLYLSVGKPASAADSEETPEGHAVRFDDDGNIIGVTIVDAKSITERDGEIVITFPSPPPAHLDAETLAPAFG